MEERDDDKAQFFAHLASIRSLEELGEEERLRLEERFFSTFFDLEEFVPRHTTLDFSVPIPPKEEEIQDALRKTHEKVWALVVGLLDGKMVRAPNEEMAVYLYLAGNTLREHRVSAETYHDNTSFMVGCAVTDLVSLLQHHPFLFRRCPVCQDVFVRVKRQLYCSPTCTAKALEDMRKDKHREYMRGYMARKREKDKVRKRRKER